MLHPLTRILVLLLLAVLLQWLPPLGLSSVLGGGLVILAGLCYPALLKKMLYRSRWLLLTLLLVYAFTTPGEYVAAWPFELAPTHEGLASGLLQAGRLITMLAGLSLLLGSTPRERLMAGIYLLLQPLRLLGLSPQRFTARLWLTLHYAEQAPQRVRGLKWAELWQFEQQEPVAENETLALEMPAFSWLDGLLLGCLAGMMVWLA